MTVHLKPNPSRTLLLIAVSLLILPSAARADKKEFLALTQQIATLQGQVAEADQARIESQKELRRIVDLLVEQSAMIKKLQQDLKFQDERAMVAIKDQQERLSEISDRLRSGASRPRSYGRSLTFPSRRPVVYPSTTRVATKATT